MAPLDHRRKARGQTEHFLSQSKPDHPLDASIPFHEKESAIEFSELNQMTRREGFSLGRKL
jgi:hypothetical protein